MSYETKYPGAANLIGNVTISRNIHPTIRSGTRRTSPDFSSSVPYYPSATGKTLRITYTKEVSSVVTTTSVDVTFSGNGMSTIIAAINAADSTNIAASDVDGFLTLTNLNPGKTHRLTITPFSTPSSDAAPFLGFPVDPFPGSTSFAGELAAAPGSRVQSNPQTTTLIAKDDDIGSAELNRPLYSILQLVENLRAELSRDVVVYRDVLLNFSAHNPGPVAAANINDDTLRIFYPFPDVDPPTVLDPSDLSPYYRVLDSEGEGEAVRNFGSGTTNANAATVTNLYYATSLTTFSNTAAFSTWGTPDGGTIVSSTVTNKDKHPSTGITSIVGNIVFCSSATFLTHKVKVGDPVKITATVLQPFDHTGWYAVDAVIDETHLAIRPMASSEDTPDGTGLRPRWMNPAGGGTLRVAVGRFIPAGNIFVAIDTTLTTTTQVIRLPVGVPFISTLTEDRAKDLSGNLKILSSVLQDHLNSSPDRHPATSITGFTSATTFVNGHTITGTNLKQTIEDILTKLGSQTIANSGTARIGAEAITISGSAPNSIAQGSVVSQITALLMALQSHVNQLSAAHAASAISYAGGPAWLDGVTNNSTTVEGQLDRIIDVLSSTIGAFGVGAAKIGAAAVGTDLASGTVASQLSSLATTWLKMDRINTITARQLFNDRIDATDIFATGGVHADALSAQNGLGVLAGGAFISGLSQFHDDVTFDNASATVTFDGFVVFSGTINSTLVVSGLITANAGVTAAVNQHFSTSGTGRYKHPTYTLPISAAAFAASIGASGQYLASTNLKLQFTGSGLQINAMASIPLPSGKRLLAVRVRVADSGTGPSVWSASIVRESLSASLGAGSSSLGSSGSSAGTGLAQTITISSITNPVITAGFVYSLNLNTSAASGATMTVLGAEIDFDDP